MSTDDDMIEDVARRISRAQSVCVMTGAGVSAESGIPTFRGPGGFWGEHRAQDLATPEAFARDPELVWRFYLWRRESLITCKPNPAHVAVAELEQRVPRLDLITQNVDGLHMRAGSGNVTELHGAIWRDDCTQCSHTRRFDERRFDDPSAEKPDCKSIPRCDQCGVMMRPGVVWFGETLPPAALAAVDEALARCDFVLVVGTSGVVQPAASFVEAASRGGAYAVEVNIEETPLSPTVDAVLTGKAGEILPAIVEKVGRNGE